MKWNRINHISDFCGFIWVFWAVQRHSMHFHPAVVGKGSRRSRATVPAGLAESPGAAAGSELWSSMTGGPKSAVGAFGGVSCEPFTI